MQFTEILYGLGALGVGLLVGIFILGQRRFNEKSIAQRAEKILPDAEREAKTLIDRAHEHRTEMKKQFEVEQEEFMAQLNKMEKMLEMKIALHKKRETRIADLEKVLKDEQIILNTTRSHMAEIDKNISDRLVKMTGLSHEVAKHQLLQEYERSIKEDAQIYLQRDIEWASENAIRDAKNVLSEVMYRYGEFATSESDQKKIIIQRDEIKGRIVGRGGRLIALFEELFEVDVIFNDEPSTIIVSCFNLVQQEVARRALERLIREKNITEDVIRKVKVFAEQDVQKTLQTEGENTLKILGLTGMPPDFAKLIGRLKFRTSYGQNIMRHCFEVGYFARLLAGEIGADTNVAFLGGFFHDIGKAIDQEVGGSHDVLSKEILEKYGFSWEITHAAWTHHNAIPQETVEARLVQAADAISAGRPGARAESVERYMAKIKDLQETALSFPGVKKAFAINAGREVRVIVEPDKVNDINVPLLAQNIAAKVQEKGGYPGKIKVMTVRTTKATDYAR